MFQVGRCRQYALRAGLFTDQVSTVLLHPCSYKILIDFKMELDPNCGLDPEGLDIKIRIRKDLCGCGQIICIAVPLEYPDHFIGESSKDVIAASRCEVHVVPSYLFLLGLVDAPPCSLRDEL